LLGDGEGADEGCLLGAVVETASSSHEKFEQQTSFVLDRKGKFVEFNCAMKEG